MKNVKAIGLTTVLLACFFSLSIMLTACDNNNKANNPSVTSSNKLISKKDFKLILDVPKTKLKVGESVTITARLYNRSGRDLEITNNIINDIYIAVYDYGMWHDIVRKAGKKNQTFANGTYFEKTYNYKAYKRGRFMAVADGFIDLKDGIPAPESGEQEKYIQIAARSVEIKVTDK